MRAKRVEFRAAQLHGEIIRQVELAGFDPASFNLATKLLRAQSI
jgi:hypothetical protein